MKKINALFDNGITKDIFDHIRNLLICTFLFAIGTNQLQEQNEIVFSLSQGKYVGISVIVVSFILIVINTYDGIRRINKARFHLAISYPLIILYLFLIIKVLEMGWDFRIIAH